MIDQTTLKGNKNTNSDTFRTKAPLSVKKGDYEESLKCNTIVSHLNGDETPLNVKFYLFLPHIKPVAWHFNYNNYNVVHIYIPHRYKR